MLCSKEFGCPLSLVPVKGASNPWNCPSGGSAFVIRGGPLDGARVEAGLAEKTNHVTVGLRV